jgi:hypothetical protein
MILKTVMMKMMEKMKMLTKKIRMEILKMGNSIQMGKAMGMMPMMVKTIKVIQTKMIYQIIVLWMTKMGRMIKMEIKD